jgi:hypothetical protein
MVVSLGNWVVLTEKTQALLHTHRDHCHRTSTSNPSHALSILYMWLSGCCECEGAGAIGELNHNTTFVKCRSLVGIIIISYVHPYTLLIFFHSPRSRSKLSLTGSLFLPINALYY